MPSASPRFRGGASRFVLGSGIARPTTEQVECAMAEWWRSFYDDDYLRLWGEFYDEGTSDAQAQAISTVLWLAPGARVLDAPCGFGRLSRPLAARTRAA